jgi:hypothetical protein
MIDQRNRITRLEMLLVAIYMKLPGFIKTPLGEEIRELIERIAADLLEEVGTIPIETQQRIYGLKKQ